MKANQRVLLFAAVGIILLVGVFGWLALHPREPLFRGKPDSWWIKGIAYGMSLSDSQNKEQTQFWHELGPEGLHVLERALTANLGRTYRQIYRRHAHKLPDFLVRLMPTPQRDTNQATRMCVADLLWRMGKDAWPAWPAVARALDDESTGVRAIAVIFFTNPEDDHAFLNHTSPRIKQQLLPLFIRGLQAADDRSLRNNSALALRYYPEFGPLVAPALAAALADPAPWVRLTSAESLNRVDPGTAKKAGALNVLIKLTKEPDDQIASRAAFKLRYFQNEAETAVAALIEALQSTNSLVACDAIWSLEWAFPSHAATIIPALRQAAERKDNAGGYARSAIQHLESRAGAPK